jgi:adenylate cyclase
VKMKFRIGVNLGDVVEEKGRIYGDGVNIAA